MSWAALAKKYQGQKTVEFSEPKQVLHVNDTGAVAKGEDQLDEKAVGLGNITLPEFQKGLFILDANAIIKGMDNLNAVADVYVTVPQVVQEIRDAASRELMERLPHKLVVLRPTREALKAVIDVAEKTGDLGVISRTDLHLCALALDCCKKGGCLGTEIAPRSVKINGEEDNFETVDDEVEFDEEEEEAEEDEGNEEEMLNNNGDTEAQPHPGKAQATAAATTENAEDEEDDWPEAEADDDDAEAADAENKKVPDLPGWGMPGSGDDEADGEWITPENINDIAAKHGLCENFSGGMACVTSDFAMQNVLMHLGVPIVGSNGMKIRELRQWLLRCFACFEVVTDTTRQFCPACGSGDTLRRVSYVINTDGEKRLFINFKYKISTRGVIYNLPRPRGGKRGTNKTLILREDLLAHVVRGTSSAAQAKKRLLRDTEEEDDDLAMFGQPTKHKKKDLSAPRVTSSYHRYNVNEWKKVRAAHRK